MFSAKVRACLNRLVFALPCPVLPGILLNS
ncbi:unnamed protein product [Chondrus crispus]|uniref:Uncharacterized protein n=1 Tax=Chondrus crispus TaxID=2769 RepID=R7Q670_CHOCR|nr:unnamed protein product [Chondrus crispus]CDF33489.1 unnamed protein product [Chondrus crispus]|eukprot:XP_005713292.1 unnamed protein product [Chondrus crispus]